MSDKKVAVVAGGTGSIGEGVVKALLGRGYTVYVPVREKDHSDRLKRYVDHSPELHLFPADLCDVTALSTLRDTLLQEAGRIDAVIVSVGADYFGYRLHRMPRADWDRSVQDNLATHFNMQQVFLDHLRNANGGVYITLVGPEAEHILPDAGMRSIMAAAQKMMTRVLATESSDKAIRVHALTAHTTISTRNRGDNTNREWITAGELGDYVVGLVEETIPGCNEPLHELRDLVQIRAVLARR